MSHVGFSNFNGAQSDVFYKSTNTTTIRSKCASCKIWFLHRRNKQTKRVTPVRQDAGKGLRRVQVDWKCSSSTPCRLQSWKSSCLHKHFFERCLHKHAGYNRLIQTRAVEERESLRLLWTTFTHNPSWICELVHQIQPLSIKLRITNGTPYQLYQSSNQCSYSAQTPGDKEILQGHYRKI